MGNPIPGYTKFGTTERSFDDGISMPKLGVGDKLVIRMLLDGWIGYASHLVRPRGSEENTYITCNPSVNGCTPEDAKVCEMVCEDGLRLHEHDKKDRYRLLVYVQSLVGADGKQKCEPGIRVFDVGTLIVWGKADTAGIEQLVRDDHWGDPRTYDLQIVVKKAPAPYNQTYQMSPISKSPVDKAVWDTLKKEWGKWSKAVNPIVSREDALRILRMDEKPSRAGTATEPEIPEGFGTFDPSEDSAIPSPGGDAALEPPMPQFGDDAVPQAGEL